MRSFRYLVPAASVIPAALLALTLGTAPSALAAPSQPASAPDLFAAVSYNPQTNIPYLADGPSGEVAEDTALHDCRVDAGPGNQCQGTVWVYAGWLSFASVSGGHHAAGWGWSTHKADANYYSLYYCTTYNKGNLGCVVRILAPTPDLNGAAGGAEGGNW